MSASHPSKVRMTVEVRLISITAPATSSTVIWSPIRRMWRTKMTIPANMFPSTVWKAIPAAMEHTYSLRAFTDFALGMTSVSAAAMATGRRRAHEDAGEVRP